MNEVDVFIDGAGPTGLAFAAECCRLGLSHRLVDRKPEPTKWSQALVVQARTLEQFSRYGIADRLLDGARIAKQISFYESGKLLHSIPFDRIPGRYPFIAFISQADTERALAAYLEERGTRVERSVEFENFSDTADGVAVTTHEPDGSERITLARYLIGCDGIHSKVRHGMNMQFEGHAVEVSFLLADVELTGDVPKDELRIYLEAAGDESLLFMAPLGENNYRLLVALRAGGGRESMKASDGETPGSPSDEELQDSLDRLAPGGNLRLHKATWKSYFHVSERKSRDYRRGRIFLAGDAAHVHSPAAGQGMNTGIQDAANLAWKIAATIGGAPDALLDSYNEERGRVARSLLAGTSRILDAATAGNSFVAFLRDIAIRTAPRIDPVRSRIEGFVSETSISYRGSTAVREHGGAGSLRAGDRATDADLKGPGKGALLAPLSDACHLAISIDGTVPPASSRLKVSALSGADVDDETRAAYGSGTLAVVRPDGYIGFRGPASDTAAFADYARSVGLAATHSLV